MFTNKNLPVQSTRRITVNAPIKEVWDTLVDVNLWSMWQFDISKSRINGKLQKNSIITWEAENIMFYSRIHTFEPFSKLGWNHKMLGMKIFHNWHMKENNGQTIVTTWQEIDGFFARIFKKSIILSIEYDIIRWLEFLQMECEKKKAKQSLIPKLFFEFEKN